MLESSSRTVETFIHQVTSASKSDNKKTPCSLFLSVQLSAHFRDQLPWRQTTEGLQRALDQKKLSLPLCISYF